MNLGQLIDPEWAQAGFPVRHPLRRPQQDEPQPVPEPRTVLRDAPIPQRSSRLRPGTFQIRMIEAMRAGGKMTLAEIAARINAPRTQVMVALIRMMRLGEVLRNGPRGSYRYWMKGES